MHIFITGKNGFIGRHLTPLLKDHEITERKPECFVHLGWGGLKEHDFGLRRCSDNLSFSLALIERCIDLGVKRIVVAGSCWEIDENNMLGASKNALRMMLVAACHEAKIEWRWARIHFVYGPGQRSDALLPSILRGEEIRTPDAVHDFVHVDVVARGLKRLIEDEMPSGIYEIKSGNPMTVREFAREHSF